MKCIKNLSTGEVTRVADTVADLKVKNGGFKYSPKSEYKKQFKAEKVAEPVTDEKEVTPTKAKKSDNKKKDKK